MRSTRTFTTGPRTALVTPRPDDFTHWPPGTFPRVRWFTKLLDDTAPQYWAFVFCADEAAALHAATQWTEHGQVVRAHGQEPYVVP